MINLTITGVRLSQSESIKSLELAPIYLLWGSLPRGEPPGLEVRTYLQSVPYMMCMATWSCYGDVYESMV